MAPKRNFLQMSAFGKIFKNGKDLLSKVVDHLFFCLLCYVFPNYFLPTKTCCHLTFPNTLKVQIYADTKFRGY